MSVRVRYAPSTTGLQHIGGIRTALFNYFYARSQGGSFILRIEDTDRERTTEAAVQDLYDMLNWLGITWDEGPEKGGDYGPYVQSERSELYRSYTEKLVAAGKAYRCYCTAERLNTLREEQERTRSKEKGYDRHCRDLGETERSELEKSGKPFVIRLKVPLDGKTSFDDVLMGKITRKNRDVNPDPVLMKSDGFPTYHLANVIDDHLMGITHILRAQEWIPSGPLHVLLYEAFGWDPPKYCHLPMVMGKDGQKLSKRNGSKAVRDFMHDGYLPEAVMNYITLLGWSYDDKTEFFTREELENVFSLEKINKAPGVFDYKKLDWFNGMYIRMKSAAELSELILPFLVRDGIISNPPTDDQKKIIEDMIPLIHERMKKLSDVSEMTRFLFQDIETPNLEEVIPKKANAAKALEILRLSKDLLSPLWGEGDGEEDMEQLFRDTSEKIGVGLGALLMPIRAAVTGSRISPPLFESVKLLGREKTLERINRTIQKLEQEV
ncbi:MAG: glutamate--tRNA ligase [Spirochaetes bacterium]|nr:glutamate--tRNA ligase [Spirochaetota bacterium]